MTTSTFEEWWSLLSKVPYMSKEEVASLAWNARVPDGYVVVPVELLKKIEFESNGYCPCCGGWEVEKGRGCKPKVHRKDCQLAILLAVSQGEE